MNLVISLCIFAAVLIGAFWARQNPSWWFLRDRPLDTTLWERGYSQSQIPVVICALQAIAEAFLLRKDDIYRLYPGDRLHAIYKAAYPRGGPDALEFELLSKKLMKHFKVPEAVLQQHTDPTVQDVVQLCLRYSAA
jgi:hypothetical protein